MSPPPTADLIFEAIARIEARRQALDQLADRGMKMVERLAAGETVEIAGRKPFSDPARAYAVISRAVRLCLALASRLDEALVVLLRGGPIPDLAILAPVTEPSPPSPVAEPRVRVACAVGAAIDAGASDQEAAERMRAYVHDHLTDRETYDSLLHQPWRVVVEAICTDLGVRPDWSTWDDAKGFTAGMDPPPAPRSEPSAALSTEMFDEDAGEPWRPDNTS